MKTATAGMIALLNSQRFVMCDLFTIMLANGNVLRYTNWDGDVVFGSSTFRAAGGSAAYPALTRGPARCIIGIEVDTLEVNFLVNSTVQINGVPVAQFARQGGFDGARLKLERAFLPAPTLPGAAADTSAGALIMFVGRVAEIECTRTGVVMNVNSDLELLNVMLPRNVFQAPCRHELYDAGCTLTRAALTVASTAAAGSTQLVINSAMAQASGYWNLGVLTFTSGVNNGLMRSVNTYTPGVHTLEFSLYAAPAIGDTFTVYPGCAKTVAACTAFGNLVNFGGHPTIPAPETAY
jgi:uncharacterized phage protein (TIGR02218 family)